MEAFVVICPTLGGAAYNVPGARRESFGATLIRSRNPRFFHGPFPVWDMANAPLHKFFVQNWCMKRVHAPILNSAHRILGKETS